MGNKVLVALVAGGLLVGAGFVASAVSSPGTAVAQEGTDEERSDAPTPRIMGFLEEVLDELVGDDTITRDQADAIVDAAKAMAAEVNGELRANRELLEGLLEDGAITEEEASELPDDHFLFDERFDEAWEDGELSAEDLRGLLHRHWRGPFRSGLRTGSILDDGGIDQEEYDALPDDHPLKEVDVSEYLDDGQITPDELREIFSDLKDARSDANT